MSGPVLVQKRTLVPSAVTYGMPLPLHRVKRDNDSMTSKRDYGSGSITEKAPGVWRLRVSIGTDPVTGDAIRVSRTFRGTKKQAQAELAAFVTEQRRTNGRTVMTVADVVHRYFTTSFLKPDTVANYERAWSAVPEHFRTRRATDIDADDVSALYKHIHENGLLTAHYVRQLDILLKAAFNRQHRHIAINPCIGARKPPVPEKMIELPSEDAIARLLDLVADWTEMLVWLRLLLVTGARRGESLAIRWSDINLANNTVHISDQINRHGEVVPTTKTMKERHVHLDTDTIALLLEWRDEQEGIAEAAGVTMDPDPWVFARDTAGAQPKRADSMYHRFKRYAKKAGIPKARPHHLRHFMVTHAIDDGANPEVIRKIVGHSSVTVTLNIYNHTVTGADRMAVNRIGARTPMPDRARSRSPFDNPEQLRTAIIGAASRAAILTSLGLSTAAKNYARLEQRAAALNLTLPPLHGQVA